MYRKRYFMKTINILYYKLIILVSMSLFSCQINTPPITKAYTLVETRLDKSLDFSIFVAPDVKGQNSPEVPIILLLHGMGDDNRVLEKHGLAASLKKGMAEGRIKNAHFIVPNGEKGFFVNWYDGTHPYEDHIVKDVIPKALAILGVSPDKKIHIMGASMGGQGAIRLGVSYPERFLSVTAFSTLILNRQEASSMLSNPLFSWIFGLKKVFGDATDREFSKKMDPYYLMGKGPAPIRQRFFLAVGTEEKRFHESMQNFKEFLEKLGVEHQYKLYNGGHGWKFWKDLLPEAIEFIWAEQ
jgi:enterochelin esterase-like enzyme